MSINQTYLDCTGDIQLFLKIYHLDLILKMITNQTDLDSADDVHGAGEGCPDVEEYSYRSTKLGTQRPRYHKIRP